MFDNEIMLPGERLKKIRQVIFRATQEEISKGLCTKNMISLIENNKKRLNYSLACGIAENLNRIAKEKEIDLSIITPEELLIDDDKQANYIFTNIANELKEIKVIDLFEQKLREAEELIEKYNITDNKKIELYKLAADFFYYKHIYSKSDQMCDIGLKISIDLKNSFDEVHFNIYKSRNNIVTQNYVRALQQLDYSEKLNNDIVNNNLSIEILYYRGLVYKKSGDYHSALECFQMMNKFEINDKKLLLKVKMVHANCLNDIYEFEKAEKIYRETLNIAMKYDDKDIIAQVYRNLSELYLNKKNYKYAAMNIKESLKNHPQNVHFGETLYFASKVLKHVNEDVEQYLLQSLDVCREKDNENPNLIEKIIYELVLIYIKRKDEKNIALMVEKANEFNIDYSLIYLELGDYYRGQNEEKNKYFIKKSKEKLKKNKKI
jgi:tetratricopeptide (TPR) repeat protein